MKRLLAAGVVGMLMAGGSMVGAQAEPGPNGNNHHGLCTAYFNGQKKGHDKHGSPPPFAALEAAAEEAEMSVFEWCSSSENNPKGIGGNPDDNGRFPECFDDDDSTGNDACPSE